MWPLSFISIILFICVTCNNMSEKKTKSRVKMQIHWMNMKLVLIITPYLRIPRKCLTNFFILLFHFIITYGEETRKTKQHNKIIFGHRKKILSHIIFSMLKTEIQSINWRNSKYRNGKKTFFDFCCWDSFTELHALIVWIEQQNDFESFSMFFAAKIVNLSNLWNSFETYK